MYYERDFEQGGGGGGRQVLEQLEGVIRKSVLAF